MSELEIDEVGLTPLLSPYLAYGYREDLLVLESVRYDLDGIEGNFRVDHFFCPGDGEFHLSATMAVNCLCQIAVVHACLDCGLESKPGEIYTPETNIRFRRPVRRTKFPIQGVIEKKRERAHSVHYAMSFDVASGAFLADGKLVLPVLASEVRQ
ncbi:hypothetical protein SAMN04487819_105333 [Actinopolyspora alba]|uniref:Acyl-coenzyme A thioesterase PaaI, contains HGG motif n=1 Tax=Actinopolyspora alba TaxID=673379 RepID=A0A1I1WK11_9ACTN|nr:hypothetical protein [Actinopolyspora alba]SFD95311.1 hypothetical protein SAMN04487819_105333 [Actinopolyspora alba]